MIRALLRRAAAALHPAAYQAGQDAAYREVGTALGCPPLLPAIQRQVGFLLDLQLTQGTTIRVFRRALARLLGQSDAPYSNELLIAEVAKLVLEKSRPTERPAAPVVQLRAVPPDERDGK